MKHDLHFRSIKGLVLGSLCQRLAVLRFRELNSPVEAY